MILDLGFGFFTMNHKIVSLTKRINGIYKNHDRFSLEKLFMNVSTRLVSFHRYNFFLRIIRVITSKIRSPKSMESNSIKEWLSQKKKFILFFLK